MKKILIAPFITALAISLAGCSLMDADIANTEAAINNALNPGLPSDEVPEEIEVGTIEENKVDGDTGTSRHAQLTLDDEFLSRYIDIDQFGTLRSWVISEINDAKEEFLISEDEYFKLTEEIYDAGNTIMSDMDVEAKKDALYGALTDADAAISLDMEEFLTQSQEALETP